MSFLLVIIMPGQFQRGFHECSSYQKSVCTWLSGELFGVECSCICHCIVPCWSEFSAVDKSRYFWISTTNFVSTVQLFL
jgi:hypothetical protein